MNLRKAAKRFLPPIIVDAVRWLRIRCADEVSRQYLREGVESWWHRYNVDKERLIMTALADQTLLKRLRSGEALQSGYGVGVDEHCIEYPWLFSYLNDEPEALLDAGSTLNYPYILDQPILGKKQIHILTLKPEANCFWQRGISYLYCDLRDIPVRDRYYDVVACISTLEHVGCDNTRYTRDKAHKEDRGEDFVLAMRELARVLKPDGELFLTVPFGVYRHFGFQQQFDKQVLSRAIDAFGKARKVTVAFCRYTREGWNVADEAGCAECEASWITRRRGEWPNPLPSEPDLAIGARAVACVKFIK